MILDPHGAVGWRALELFQKGDFNKTAVIYETADPGKFPIDVEKAIGITPKLPEGMQEQLNKEERVYKISGKDFDSRLEEIKRNIGIILK